MSTGGPMHHPSRRLAVSLAAATSLVLGTSALAPAAGAGSAADAGTAGRQAYADRAAATRDLVKLDLLSINDFHGNLEVVDPVSSSGRINNTPAGGVAYL